jgi:hypothetical protein
MASGVQAQAADIHYSHATRLTLCEAPDAGAAALAQLPINQPLEIVARENRWCRVRLVAPAGSADAAQEGYVNCTFLKDKKLDFVALETEAARLFLELHRENLTPSEEARILEALFTRIERHFALSPSLYAYNDYRALLRDAQRRGSGNPEFQLPAREKKRAVMLRELSRQTWEGEFPAVRQSMIMSRVENTLWKLRSERGEDSLPYRLPEYRPTGVYSNEILPAPLGVSFFSRGKWAIGWAGGPMIRRRHGSHPPTYFVEFGNEGGNEFLLNNVYEMAKALKAPVNVSFITKHISNTETLELPIVETKLPIWAITPDGLVAGYLREARLGPDSSACFDSQGSAEIVFDRPPKGRIYGVFASNAPVDPAKVKITARNKTFLGGSSLGGEQARMTYREEASVDLDGDGVADLSIMLSTDQSADLEPYRPRHAVFNGNPGGFLRVAGYYDYNAYSLLVNEEGQWHTLFLYGFVPCT